MSVIENQEGYSEMAIEICKNILCDRKLPASKKTEIAIELFRNRVVRLLNRETLLAQDILISQFLDSSTVKAIVSEERNNFRDNQLFG